MADNFITQTASKNSTLNGNMTDSLMQAALDQGMDTEDPDVLSWIFNLSSLFTASVVQIAELSAGASLPTPNKLALKFLVGNIIVPIQCMVEIAQGETDIEKTLLTNISAALVGEAVGLGAGGLLAVAGIAITAPVGVLVAAVGVGGSILYDLVADEAWDHYLGPKVMGSWDKVRNSAVFTTYGRMSDTLYACWEDMEVSGYDTGLNLNNLNAWEISSAHPEEQDLTVEYDKSPDAFTFTMGDVRASLTQVYQYHTINQPWISQVFRPDYWGETEGSAIVEEIMRHHDGDFNVLLQDGSSNKVYNYYAKGYSVIEDELLNDKSKVALWAVQQLKSYVEENNYSEEGLDPSLCSDQYLKDRALFLTYFLHGPENTGDDIEFTDMELDEKYVYSVVSGGFDSAQYFFGKDTGETLAGCVTLDREDHLYGMGGNDTIYGYGGDDYIEGGKGADTMYGSDGDDTFYVIGTDTKEAFDIFNGGADTDTIQGSQISDTIRVNMFEGDDTVEKIDGGGVTEADGRDILAGTDLADTIDLTGTEVTNIHEISLGGSEDTLRVKEGQFDEIMEKIDGGAGTDTITGGEGGFFEIGDPDMTIDLSDLEVSGIENIKTGDDTDTIRLDRAVLKGNISSIETGEGLDIISMTDTNASGAAIGTISGGDGDNTYSFSGLTANTIEAIEGGADKDKLNLSRASAGEITSIDLREGENSLSSDSALDLKISQITGGNDKDNFTFSNAVNLDIGTADLKNGENKFSVSYSQSLQIGQIKGGINNDTIGITDSTVTSDIEIYTGNGQNNVDLSRSTLGASTTVYGGADRDTFTLTDAVINEGLVLDGGDGENTFDLRGASGSAVNITIQGGKDIDTVMGSELDEKIYGGGGEDILAGGGGTDHLYGGIGKDTYVIGAGTAYITDEDNDGIIKDIEGNVLGGTWLKSGSGYEHSATGATASYSGSVLTITLKDGGGTAVINNFEDGRFGINLGEEAPEAYEPDINGVSLHGDFELKDFYDDGGNVYHKKDSLGNWIRDEDKPDPGRQDDLRDGEDNDELYGYGGIDFLYGVNGGDNILDGGTGDDWAEDGEGKGTLIGGEDTDALFGGGDTDVLYADLKLSHEELLGAYADGEASGEKGDLLSGQDGDDLLYGWQGDDVLLGGTGHDFIYGGAGDDTIEGDLDMGWYNANNPWAVTRTVTTENDTTIYNRVYSGGIIINGTDPEDHGNDTIFGGGGNDWIYAGYGDDDIDAGADDDVVFGEQGNDTILGGGGDDHLSGDSAGIPVGDQGEDIIFGGSGNDKIWGGEKDDILSGGEGDDIILGDYAYGTTNGEDFLAGGGGNDFLAGGGNGDILDGGDGDDTLYGDGGGSVEDEAYHGDDFITGGSGEDTIVGAGGADILLGGDDNDQIWGDKGVTDRNSLYNGDDFLDGGNGEDYLEGGGGNDIIYGGEDNDIIAGDATDDVLSAADHGDDTIFGDGGDDTITGGGGNDTIEGGTGDDIIWGDDIESNLYIDNHGNDIIYGGEGNDILRGGGGDDQLYGGEGNDTLYAGWGNDTMDGGLGDDTYSFALGSGYKRITDPGGNDRLVLEVGITLDMLRLGLGSLMITTGTEGDEIHLDGVDHGNIAATSPIDVIEFSDGQTMTVSELIELKGIDIASTEEADVLEGTSGKDNINGLGGDDEVYAGDGGDIIDLGAGNDTVYSGDGDDTVDGNTGSDTIYGNAGKDTLHGNAGDDTIDGGAGEDLLYGDAGNDTLYGGRGNDRLDGGEGINQLSGGAGDDHYIVRTSEDSVIEADDEGRDTVFAGLDYTLTENVENLELAEGGGPLAGTGNDLDNTITGNESDNVLRGLAGADTLNGGGGNDTLDGGLGTDTLAGGGGDDLYYVDDAGDGVVEVSGQGHDRVVSETDHTLAENVEDLDLAETGAAVSGTGNDLDNALAGNSLDNSLSGLGGADTLIGGAGSDILDGGAGADTMTGGSGDDTYHVDEAGDSVAEADGEGRDRVIAGIDYTLGDHVEDLELAQGAGTGTGNSLDNILTGNEGDNVLAGLEGNDTLYGGAGSDTLDGGSGTDTMEGGTGDDTYRVHSADDSVVELGDEGRDKVISDMDYILGDHLEDLELAQGSGAAAGTGNSLDNSLTGNGLDNTLLGLGGEDTLDGGMGNDTLDGGSGADTLAGGGGSDLFLVDNAGDTIVELEGEGIDHVKTSVDYTLSDHVEDLTLLDGALNGTGNGLANVITGNDNDNILDGQGGGDTLAGGLGNDTYRVVSQADTVVEASGAGTDTIESLDDYTLGDHVENLCLTGTASSDGTGNGEDNVITGNSGNNTLEGGGGNDELFGGSGSDRLVGGAGTDILTGGEGNDTYVIDSLEDSLVEEGDQGWDTVESSVSYTLGAEFESLTLTGDQDIDATGNEGNNVLTGNSGSNRLDGGAGSDSMTGGEGDDTYYTDGLGDEIYENEAQGMDTEIRSHDSDFLLAAHVENLTLTGSVYRGNGNELDNTITGNDGENNLWGREGSDTLYGMGGDDQLIGDAGADHLEGGADNDLLSGGADNDTLLGGSGNDQLDGGAGVNALKGGLGNDKYVYGDDGGIYEIDNSDGGEDWLIFTDDLTADRLDFIKSGEDLIVRVDGDESRQVSVTGWFLGSAYQLYAIQPSGASGITADTINRMFPPADAEADTITVPADSAFEEQWYGTASDEQLIGTDAHEIIRGYQGADTLFARGGNDWVLGGSGNDYLDGGTGNDTLHGGAGNDRYVFRPGDGEDTIDNSGGGTDWLLFADGLTQDRLIFSQEGDDLVITVRDSTDKLTVTHYFLGADYEIDYIQPDGGYGLSPAQIGDLLAAQGSDFDTVVDGTEADEQLTGSSGKDQINGLDGADQLFGLGDNDELNGGDGADYLDGGEGDDIQNGGAGNDQLGGDAGNDILTGGLGDDTYVYRAGAGADTIQNQDGGTDWLIFSDDITGDRLSFIRSENDLVIRVDDDETTQVTVTDWFADASCQLSYVQPSGETAMTAAQINDLFTAPTPGDSLEIPDESSFDYVNTGTSAGEQVIGSNNNDLLQGLEGDDQLFAFAGNDWLVGGEGNDYFDGGAGSDTMIGGAGNDQLGGDAGNDTMAGGADDDTYVYRPGSGADTIYNAGGGTDWLIFTDDITEDRLGYFRSGDDLLVKIDNSSDTMVTVKDWFLGGENQVAYIQPSGGYGISAAQINTMVEPEPVAAAAPGVIGDTASALAMGNDSDYTVFSMNAGLYLDEAGELGVSDDLTPLAETDENTKTLLAAV